jgi:hypothetical protein
MPHLAFIRCFARSPPLDQLLVEALVEVVLECGAVPVYTDRVSFIYTKSQQ